MSYYEYNLENSLNVILPPSEAGFYFARISQNATALAAATLRESTPCAMGMRTV